MKRVLAWLPAGAALASCVPASTPPEPLPPPRPQPRVEAPAPALPRAAAPTPSPSPAPAPSTSNFDWAGAPLSPGAWAYRPGAGGRSRALFGRPGTNITLEVACSGPDTLDLIHAAADAGPLTVRTSSTTRTLAGARSANGVTTQLRAGDPLLDAMAFSRGRFSVEAPGSAPLVIPAWPELARVIEDCRR